MVIDTPELLPPAQVDANQIELAVLNLAINARDAMPNGGQIRICVEQEDDPASRSILRLSVSDTGAGMDELTLKKAIEPFFSTKPPGKGTGLGLSMVHGLAVQLGGRLELFSEIGQGTRATLLLPIATQPALQSVAVKAQPARTRSSARILVVDDDPLIADSTVDMLEDLGHTVVQANSAKQALEMLDNGKGFDLLMTDQAMPGMTGIELVGIVRRKQPDLPVLLATGYADLPTGPSVEKLARLSKPYLQAQLQEQIDRLLSLHQ